MNVQNSANTDMVDAAQAARPSPSASTEKIETLYNAAFQEWTHKPLTMKYIKEKMELNGELNKELIGHIYSLRNNETVLKNELEQKTTELQATKNDYQTLMDDFKKFQKTTEQHFSELRQKLSHVNGDNLKGIQTQIRDLNSRVITERNTTDKAITTLGNSMKNTIDHKCNAIVDQNKKSDLFFSLQVKEQAQRAYREAQNQTTEFAGKLTVEIEEKLKRTTESIKNNCDKNNQTAANHIRSKTEAQNHSISKMAQKFHSTNERVTILEQQSSSTSKRADQAVSLASIRDSESYAQAARSTTQPNIKHTTSKPKAHSVYTVGLKPHDPNQSFDRFELCQRINTAIPGGGSATLIEQTNKGNIKVSFRSKAHAVEKVFMEALGDEYSTIDMTPWAKVVMHFIPAAHSMTQVRDQLKQLYGLEMVADPVALSKPTEERKYQSIVVAFATKKELLQAQLRNLGLDGSRIKVVDYKPKNSRSRPQVLNQEQTSITNNTQVQANTDNLDNSEQASILIQNVQQSMNPQSNQINES